MFEYFFLLKPFMLIVVNLMELFFSGGSLFLEVGMFMLLEFIVVF